MRIVGMELAVPKKNDLDVITTHYRSAIIDPQDSVRVKTRNGDLWIAKKGNQGRLVAIT